MTRENIAIRDPQWPSAVLEAAPDAMFVLDGERRILFANPVAERALGKPRSELAGTPIESWFADESGASIRDGLESLSGSTEDRPPERRDLFGLGPVDQRARWDAAFGRGGVVVLRDVTRERRAAEQDRATAVEARAARERLEALVEIAPAFIIAVSARGTIEFINRTLPQYSKEGVIGISWLAFFPPERHAAMDAARLIAQQTGVTQNFETSLTTPDGSIMWFATQIAPMREGDEIVGSVLVSQDVTDKKRAHAELLAGRQMALLGTLAAGVAHEINTPVQYVGDSIQFLRKTAGDLLGLLDTLRELRPAAGGGTPDAMSAEAKAEDDADLPFIRENMPHAFESCVEGLDRVATIVRSLKEFAHPSDVEKPADLNRAIQSALTIATNECRFVADVETDLGDLPPVMCHAGEISQVVLNIVVNAAHAIGDVVKGTDKKGVITVKTRREGDLVCITIGDTGGGIPEKIRPRIFDPFFTTKEVGRGTGQGLAIAWSMVKERHAGELTFETKIGEGTTFFVRLRIAGKS